MKSGLDHQIHHWSRKASGDRQGNQPTRFGAIFVPVVDPYIHDVWIQYAQLFRVFGCDCQQNGDIHSSTVVFEMKQKRRCERAGANLKAEFDRNLNM